MPILRWMAGLAALSLIAGGSSTACSDDQGLQVSVASVVVEPSTATIGVGGNIRFTARLLSAGGGPLEGSVTWSSSDPSIASVSEGLVTGLSAGTVTIRASAAGATGSAQLEVTPGGPPTGVQAMEVAWVTYLGGSGLEQLRDIATDAAGNVYVAGGTTSSDFPVSAGAWDATFNSTGSGGEDVFVAKLAPDGGIIWATYVGGPEFDRAYAIEVGPQGGVYIAGRAGAGFPVTAGAFQTGFAGSIDHVLYGRQDGFVCRLSSGGDVDWCSYFGNTAVVPIRDIAVDAGGDVYLMTSNDPGSSAFPQAWFATAYQPAMRGQRDALVVRVAGDGSRVHWATYLGGSGDEQNTNSIRIDRYGDVYVMIATASPDMPTPNGFDATLSGPSDYFVGKLSGDGSRLLWGTYLGGSGREWTETHELAIDSSGNAIVAAKTLSSDFPVTTGAFQRTFGGMGGSGTGQGTNYPGDAFATKIAADGSRILASTFVGGSDGEGAEGAAVDARGNIYFTGVAFSQDFPETTDTLQTTFGEAEAIAVMLSSDLSTLQFSARIGGADFDEGRTSHVAADGSFYIGGQTMSANLKTIRPIQSVLRGGSDALLVKVVPKTGG